MKNLFQKPWSTLEYLKFVLPSVLSMMTITLYVVVDAVFISRFVGPLGLAAVNILMPFFGLCFGIGIMMAAGGSAIVGIELGKGEKRSANAHFSLVFWFLLIVMVLIFVTVHIAGIGNIAEALGASESLLPYCIVYLRFFIYGIMGVLLQVFFEFFMRLDGKPLWAMYSSIIGGLTNLVLDYTLIVKLDMGIAGAGIASSLGTAAAVSTGLYYFLFKAGTLKLGKAVVDTHFIRRCMINGSSEMVTELSSGIKIFVFNLVLLKYAKEHGVAAMAILMHLYYIFSSLHIGLSMGVSPVLSFSFGDRNFNKIREILLYTACIALTASVCAYFLAVVLADDIIRMFTGDPALTALAQGGMLIFAFTFLVNGTNILTSGFFTAMGNGRLSALVSFSNSLVLTLGFVAVLPFFFGLNGVWLSVPLAETTAMGLSLCLLFRYRRRYITADKIG